MAPPTPTDRVARRKIEKLEKEVNDLKKRLEKVEAIACRLESPRFFPEGG